MTVFIQKLPDFTNLTNTGTASLELPTGMSYHNIVLDFTGSTALTRAMIKEVRVLINGKAFIRAPASIIHRDNLYKGSEDDATKLLLDFEEPRSRAMADQLSMLVHTYSGVATFKIELDIVGATNPKITAHANMSASTLALGYLPCFIKQSVDAVTVGTKQVQYGYSKDAGHLLRRAYFVPIEIGTTTEKLPSDHITHLSLLKSNVPFIQKVSPSLAAYLQKHYEAIPQTNFMVVDFVQDNNIGLNLYPVDNQSIWEIEVSAPAKFDIYYSVMTTLDKI